MLKVLYQWPHTCPSVPSFSLLSPLYHDLYYFNNLKLKAFLGIGLSEYILNTFLYLYEIFSANKILITATTISKINTDVTLKYFVINPVTNGITMNAALEAKLTKAELVPFFFGKIPS